MTIRRSILAALLSIALAACADTTPTRFDGGVPDAAPMDAAVDTALDATADVQMDAPADAIGADGGALPGFGAIAGPCAMITAELTTPTSSYFLNRLDFGADPYDDPADLERLTAGGQEILAEGTAGGSSGLSEAFAYEVLARCEGATLVKTETEIVYDTAGALTDILVEIDGVRLGVSVTRAFVFPPTDPFTVAIATERLTGKLSGVLESSENVSEEDAWTKQILLIVAYADMHAESLMTAYGSLDPSLTADTIVYVVVTDGMDEPLY
jgi:hypothetical protein